MFIAIISTAVRIECGKSAKIFTSIWGWLNNVSLLQGWIRLVFEHHSDCLGDIYIYCNTIILHHDIVYIPPTIIISLSSHIYEATPCSKTKIVTIGNNMETKTHLVLKCSEDLKKQRVETTASDSPNIDQEAPASALNPWSRSVWPMQRPCPSWLTGWYRSSAGEGGLGMVSRAETKEVWKKTNEKPWKSHRFFGGNHRNMFFFTKNVFLRYFS